MRIEQVKKEDEQAVWAGIVAFEFGIFEAAIRQAERHNNEDQHNCSVRGSTNTKNEVL